MHYYIRATQQNYSISQEAKQEKQRKETKIFLYLHSWEFLRSPSNSQKTGNSVRKGDVSHLLYYLGPSDQF